MRFVCAVNYAFNMRLAACLLVSIAACAAGDPVSAAQGVLCVAWFRIGTEELTLLPAAFVVLLAASPHASLVQVAPLGRGVRCRCRVRGHPRGSRHRQRCLRDLAANRRRPRPHRRKHRRFAVKRLAPLPQVLQQCEHLVGLWRVRQPAGDGPCGLRPTRPDGH